MKILVVGVEGLLGSDVFAQLCRQADFEVFPANREQLDICNYKLVTSSLPDVDLVVNCVGERDVDEAELDRVAMFNVNMRGARNLAMACKARRCGFVHFSSHHVFDGMKNKGYTERDVARPLNVYGSSKLAGDKEIRSIGGNYLIVRTQTLYGKHGDCPINRMITAISQGSAPLLAASDEVLVPTWTLDVADALIRLIRLNKTGVVNFSASGHTTHAGLARFIAARINPGAIIEEVLSAQLNRPARRPLFGVLDNHWYQSWTGEPIATWEERLGVFLDQN